MTRFIALPLIFCAACGKYDKTVVSSSNRQLARMYVAALEVDSLKNKYELPERYPTGALMEIGKPFEINGEEFKNTLGAIERDPAAKAKFDSLVVQAIEEATIRSINEKDTVKE
ncbi:MAG: hypothetical protein KDC45_02580 [Bacteroidetes bacterium]|nr:hypothetical protein [Bacteroidota bacterium]